MVNNTALSHVNPVVHLNNTQKYNSSQLDDCPVLSVSYKKPIVNINIYSLIKHVLNDAKLRMVLFYGLKVCKESF